MTGPLDVHVVLPEGVDDPARPSGGNRYDRQVCQGLAAGGRRVRPVAVPGSWPRPEPRDLAELAAALSTVPDGAIVLLDGLVACAAPEVVVPEAARLRLVVLVHLPLADETGLPAAVARRLDARERHTVRAAAAVVVTSAAAGRRLAERHGLARVDVAAPGVEAAPVAPGTAGGTRLLCVASVTPRKGHLVLIKALADLGTRAWTCVCAGPIDRDGPYAGLVRRQMVTSGVQHRMSLVGPRTGEELDATYADADLLVLASHAEPYGMVVTEALARGIPVLATAVDGVPEALGRAPDGTLPGILVPPGDPAALAAALRDWLDQPGLRHGLRTSAAGRRTTLRRWDDTTRELGLILDRVSDHLGAAG